MSQTRASSVTCCGPIPTKKSWVGERTIAVSPLHLELKLLQSSSTNTTLISSAEPTRSRSVVFCFCCFLWLPRSVPKSYHQKFRYNVKFYNYYCPPSKVESCGRDHSQMVLSSYELRTCSRCLNSDQVYLGSLHYNQSSTSNNQLNKVTIDMWIAID